MLSEANNYRTLSEAWLVDRSPPLSREAGQEDGIRMRVVMKASFKGMCCEYDAAKIFARRPSLFWLPNYTLSLLNLQLYKLRLWFVRF